MNLWRLIVREIVHNKLSFGLGLISVTVAVGVFVAELTILKAHDLQTHRILAEKEKKTAQEMARMEDDYRKIMKDLGFNLLILPKGQRLDNFYSDGYATKFMPEEYVERLSNSDLITIRHLLPALEQKVRWQEQSNRTIILVGTRGEVPFMQRDTKEPILVAVPHGKIVLGFELWNSMGLQSGDMIKLLGESFQVKECYPQRGSKDDITAWIDLKKAQELFGKEGKINAIMALKCHCEGADIASLRRDIGRILPDTQIIQFENKVTARARARDRAKAAADSALAAEKIYRSKLRHEKESFASWLIPLVILGSSGLIALIAFNNVRERRHEVGILRALGLRSKQIFFIFFAKSVLVGLLGAVAGYICGFAFGIFSGEISLFFGEAPELLTPDIFVLVIIAAPLLTSCASWIPAEIASRQDPAIVLKEE